MVSNMPRARLLITLLSAAISLAPLPAFAQAASSQMEGLKPVSYTHLTLPTICSV